MLKPFNQYTLEMYASVDAGVAAQILCYQDQRFVGRIDFHAGEPLPDSYLWHPNGPGDPNQTYLVLAMPLSQFGAIAEIVRTEKPFGLELWPSGELFGAWTDGYGGVLRSLDREPVGEEERRFILSARPAAGARKARKKGSGPRRRKVARRR